jgi:hypothetical protein
MRRDDEDGPDACDSFQRDISSIGLQSFTSDRPQHFLVVGTAGAGKTEMAAGFCANALTWGSGFLYYDGRGDVSLFANIYAFARRFGREDDLAGRDPDRGLAHRRTWPVQLPLTNTGDKNRKRAGSGLAANPQIPRHF